VEIIEDTMTQAIAEVGEVLSLALCVAYVPSKDDEGSHTRWGWSSQTDATAVADFDGAALPWIFSRTRAGESVALSTLADLPSAADRDWLQAINAHACAAVPVNAGTARGALVAAARDERAWPSEIVDGLRLVAAVIGQGIARRRDRDRQDSRLAELRQQRSRTAGEEAILRRDVRAMYADLTMACESVAIRRSFEQAQQVAPTTATVLLLGETGVGKEVFAQAIHNMSPRHRRTMIKVCCAAIPAPLIESELFGRERGAFTGALSRQIGRFEAANGSTIFLDEIGDLPLEIQIKLLRVIQERTVERLGGNDSMKVDVRIVAATNRNLEQAVAAGTFREDLFYRLNVFPIMIPPLRERLEDIPSLVWTFVDEFSRTFGKRIDAISKDSLAQLQRYSWPGNVRELRNVVEREMIIATGTTLTITVPRMLPSHRRSTSTKLVDVEIEHIRSVLETCGWRIRGNGGAAERLGVKPTTLESRMARLGIVREKRATAAACA
jgi:transcriptional regulator with GAF, ATPase, and Fis domain